MTAYTFRPIRALGSIAAAWLVVAAVEKIAVAVLAAVSVALLLDPQAPSPAALALWNLLPAAMFVLLAINIVAMIIVGRWIYRASVNAHAGRRGLEISPPWSVGWYFIPLANYVMPFRAMKEIWNAATPGNEQPSSVLSLWWTLWLIGILVGGLANIINRMVPSVDGAVLSSAAAIVSSIALAAAGLVLRRIVSVVSSAQDGHISVDVF